MYRRREKKSKGKLYLAIFIILLAVVVLLGTKDIPNESQEVAVDITEQVKAKK
jgi:hypothetical protein